MNSRIFRICALGALVGCVTILESSESRADVIYVDAGRGPVTVHLPTGYDPDTPAPLLLLLHPYTGTPGSVENTFQFGPYADANGYIYCRPPGRQDAYGGYWDATECCDYQTPMGDEDSIYLRDLIEAIEEAANVDPRRIYVAGRSNGGSMAYRMACDHSEKIAAIFSQAGPMYNPDNAAELCKPTQPVHILHIHGTLDTVAIYNGGTLNWPGHPLDGLPYPSVDTTIGYWKDYNMCDSRVEFSGGSWDFTQGAYEAETEISFWPSGCHVASSVELWRMVAEGHHPDFTDLFREKIFEFFAAHPKQEIELLDSSTISWPATSVAESYRIYRGFIADLVDADDDGLPDQEYGACISQFDPDVTDTVHVDSDEPSVGEGFFYLLSYVVNVPLLGDQEGGLGKTGAGLHRTNSIQCP